MWLEAILISGSLFFTGQRTSGNQLFFFFGQFLANAQAELCLLKRKIIYWHFGVRLGLHGQSNLPSRTISRWPAAMGCLLQGSFAVSSSPGSGQTPKPTVLLSSYNPAGQGPTWWAQHVEKSLLLQHLTQRTFLKYHSYRHHVFHNGHFWRNGFYLYLQGFYLCTIQSLQQQGHVGTLQPGCQ